MSKIPVVSPGRMEKLLLKIGFIKTRQKGSHAFYKHPDGRVTTIAHHKGRDISRPLLCVILREIDLSSEDYVDLLKNIR